jgi:hypothetical protein
MTPRLIVVGLLFAAAICAQVKTKRYTDPEGCIRSYDLAPGRVLTSKGLIEDPTVNAIMKDAVSAQMKSMKVADASKGADVEIRFMGGNGAGLQIDDLMIGDVAMWNIGGYPAVSGRTYKKSSLVIAVVDNRSKQTIWAARYSDNFGDPNRLRERIQNGVTKVFAKFPKKFVCGS